MVSKNEKNKTMKMLASFLKVGIIGFGGGSALIPVIEKEIVQKNGGIDAEEYNKHTIIANITPGTLPTKLAALSDMKLSIPAAYVYTLPGIIILVAFLGLLSSIGSGAIHYIEYASVGISTFIIFLLVEYIHKVMMNGRRSSKFTPYILIMLAAFLVTGGKEIRSIISMLTGIQNEALLSPIIDIQTIDLMIAAFFVILFIGANATASKKLTAAVVTVLYILSAGDQSPFPAGWNVRMILLLIICVLTAVSIIVDLKNNPKKSGKQEEGVQNFKKILFNIAGFILIPVVLFVIALIVTGNGQTESGLGITGYFLNSIISTVTSFGGGEAYISIAEGFFVETGYVPANLYYSQIVAIANALPGPILVKVIAGVGFEFGVLQFGSTAVGLFIAALGTAAAIGFSSVAALVVLIFFAKLKSSPRLAMVQAYILPVVCGMLISTSLSMLYESQKIISHSLGSGVVIAGTAAVIVLFGLITWISKKTKLSDVLILLIAAGITLASILLLSVMM